MAEKRGAHGRQSGQQGANQQGANRQGASRATGRPQGTRQQAAGRRDAYGQSYQRYGGQQGSNQRAAGKQGAYKKKAAQPAMPSRPQDKQIYTFDDDYFAQYDLESWGGGKKRKRKSHALRNTLIVILVVLVVVAGVGGFTGYTLYESAKQVRSDASAVMSDISTLTDKVMSDDPGQATAIAANIADRAKSMKQETEGWAWSVAAYVPVYGSDVVKVRELANVLDDLSTNAIVPLVDEVSQISMSNLMTDGAINVPYAKKLVSAINDAAPIIKRSADTIDAMGAAQLEQINRPLAKARTAIDGLNTVAQFVAGIAPTFSDMLGASGNPRTYLIVAQGNSEIRSTGGFLGSIGPLYIDNGVIKLGDFRGISDIYPKVADTNATYAPLTDEELSIFGPHVSYQIADSNFIPDFSRVGEIVKYAWEVNGYEHVDGVIGVDPVFLQDMLAIAGPVTTSTGVTIDGTNAAQYLLHDVYYLPTEDQDPLFEEVAQLAFNQLMSNLGSVSLTELSDIVNKNVDARRFQAWMVADNEESAMELIGCDGKLSHDAENPVLGAYFNDESWSKMFWYIKVESTVGAGAKNADGSTTYPVTVTYRNMIEPGHEGELSNYMKAHNNEVKRSDGDMITMVVLTAPEGGKITDVEAPGTYIPAGFEYRAGGQLPTGTMTEATLQGLDTWWGEPMVLPGESFTISCKVTTSPQATTPLTVMRTATCQEVAGW